MVSGQFRSLISFAGSIRESGHAPPALGIEIRTGTTARTGAWAKVGTELRERALSRLGLADVDRPDSRRAHPGPVAAANYLTADIGGSGGRWRGLGARCSALVTLPVSVPGVAHLGARTRRGAGQQDCGR